MSNKETKIDRIKKKLSDGDFLKHRNYRKDQLMIKKEYWNVMCVILHSSRVTSVNNEYSSPADFMEIIVRSFNHIFLDIGQTKSNVKEIARQSGISSSYWEKNKSEIDQFFELQRELLSRLGKNLHQNIKASLNNPSLIYRSEPVSISVYAFDKWHKKLNQPVSSILLEYYPKQLISVSGDDIRLSHNISINDKLIKEYHRIATEMVKAAYINSLIEEVNRFFHKNPKISTFYEDLLV